MIERWCIALVALALTAPGLAAQEQTEQQVVQPTADPAAAAMEGVTEDRPIPPGLYNFVPEESEEIEGKIRDAVDHMFFAIRGIARGRLAGANEPIDRVFIDYAGDTLIVSLRSDEPVVETLMNGEYTPYTRGDGEVVQVKADVEPALVDMYFESDDGEKQMIFKLREDGSIAIESISYSEKLEEPFRYTWVYAPESDGSGSGG